MASQFDDSDFIDREYQESKSPYSATPAHPGGAAFRPPSRGELETRVSDAQQKLAQLRRAQEELERERVALEEARRRRLEYQTGREEMLQSLTRGLALMEQAEFNARRDAEQMAKTLQGLREAFNNVQTIKEETWTEDNWNMELSKALASIENARLEWNQARLKWALLNGPEAELSQKNGAAPVLWPGEGRSFLELCKLGVALTWPVALIGLVGLVLWAVFSLK